MRGKFATINQGVVRAALFLSWQNTDVEPLCSQLCSRTDSMTKYVIDMTFGYGIYWHRSWASVLEAKNVSLGPAVAHLSPLELQLAISEL